MKGDVKLHILLRGQKYPIQSWVLSTGVRSCTIVKVGEITLDVQGRMYRLDAYIGMVASEKDVIMHVPLRW